MRPTAVIFDVDGTLADVSGIRHHVLTRPKNFDAFHAESIDAPPHHWVVRAAQDYADAGVEVLVVTARSSQWRYHTMIWLYEQGVPHSELYMRAAGDSRPDYEVKRDILRTIRRDFEPVAAYDDNPSVLRLWREEGIPTVEVPGWAREEIAA